MSEWKEHDGGPQPEETVGRRVHIRFRDGRLSTRPFYADHGCWPHDGYLWDIAQYYIVDTDEAIHVLRDEFAMAALTGLLAHASGEDPHNAPAMAYALADAMLAARKEK